MIVNLVEATLVGFTCQQRGTLTARIFKYQCFRALIAEPNRLKSRLFLANVTNAILPDAPLAPAGKAIVDRLVGTVPLRAVDPAAANLRHLCMIPLKISRSSLRRDPALVCPVEPKQMRLRRLAAKPVDQPVESKHG